MIVGNAARLPRLGLAIGVVLALALSRTLTSLLYETAGTDPLTFAAVSPCSAPSRSRPATAGAPRIAHPAGRSLEVPTDVGILVGLGVGIDYALFIVTQHRSNLKDGMPPRKPRSSR